MMTTDTRVPDCQIRIVYTEVLTGNSLHANELDHRVWGLRPVRPLAVIAMTEHGAYNGDTVHASNYRVLWDAHSEHLVQICGPYGYKALAYDATLGPVPPTEELCGVIENLEDYPLIDEDDHGALEMELESEAWGEYGLKDFRKALTSALDDIDGEDHEHELPDDDVAAPEELADHAQELLGACYEAPTWKVLLADVWRAGCDAFNVNGGSGVIIETGCVVHFCIDEWIKSATRSMMGTRGAAIAVRDLLREMARVTRIVE